MLDAFAFCLSAIARVTSNGSALRRVGERGHATNRRSHLHELDLHLVHAGHGNLLANPFVVSLELANVILESSLVVLCLHELSVLVKESKEGLASFELVCELDLVDEVEDDGPDHGIGPDLWLNVHGPVEKMSQSKLRHTM